MQRKTKKGFTIVELVIVIAVIGVLTAILVPTFISLNAKANKASDQSLVTNLNTALKMQEAEDGEKNPTMHDAVLDLEKQGYKLSQLVSKSKEDLVYNLKENQFYLTDAKEVKNSTKQYEFWKIYKEVPALADQTFSIYAGHEWKEAVSEASVKVGFDAGSREEITKVEYTNPGAGQEVVIRTNHGTLTVNAPLDTVKHYGDADSVDIISVASTSYHEYGEVNLAKITNGRIVITEDAAIGGIHAVATGSGEAAYFNDIVVGVVGNATVPSITRDRVAIDDVEDDGKYSQFVLEVQALTSAEVEVTAQNKDYIWINVTIESGAKTGADALVVSDTAVTESTKTLNTGDGVQVVATAEPSKVASNVTAKTETAVYVTNAIEFQTALNEGKKYIVIAKDFTTEKFKLEDDSSYRYYFSVTKNVVIDGNGKTITANFGNDGRGIVIDADNVTVTIKNLTMTGTTARNIQVHPNHTGVKLLMDHIDITSSMYAINMCSDVEVDITLTNSKVTSWGALNLWSEKYSVYVANCELYGINDKGYNAEGWNDFGTVVLEGDTTGETTLHASEIDVQIVNTKIFASQTTGNTQYHITFNNPSTSNTVTLLGCSFFTDGEKTNTPVVYNEGSGNKLYINGELFQ